MESGTIRKFLDTLIVCNAGQQDRLEIIASLSRRLYNDNDNDK
jgi:hypothetical protein